MAATVVAGASGNVVGGSTMVANKPAGTANGDVMLAFQTSNWDAQTDLTAPAGWSLLTQLDRGASNLHLKIWSKVASSEGTSYTFTPGPSADSCLSIITVRGADNTPANWLYATPTWSAAAASRVAPSVSGAGTGALLLCYAMSDTNGNAATSLPPSGMTEVAETQSTTWLIQTVASLASPANPTGTKAFTLSNAFGGSYGGIQFSIVMPQASGGGGPVSAGGMFFAS